MAFFGLTALGPQNSFLSSSKNFRNLQIFDDADFTASWKRMNGKDAQFCQASKLGEIMENLFRGPVPPNDNDCIVTAFEEEAMYFETSGVLSYMCYIKTLKKLKAEAEAEEEFAEHNPLPTCEYTSSQLIQDDMLRNKRCKADPNQKQCNTLTCSQEYGWHAQPELVSSTRAARQQSEITKFAAELIKNGVY